MQLYRLSFPNGKKYIGITSRTVQERFNAHCHPSQNRNPCQHAIHKYGKENVKVTILAECNNWELLCLAEFEAIEKYQAFGKNGYNLTLGGEGNHVIDIYGSERAKRDKALAQVRAKVYNKINNESIAAKRSNHYKANKGILATKYKAYRELNKESIAIQQKTYYSTNRDMVIAKNKAYIEANKELVAARKKAYTENNKELVAAYQKAYREANKESLAAKKKKSYEDRKQLKAAYTQ